MVSVMLPSGSSRQSTTTPCIMTSPWMLHRIGAPSALSLSVFSRKEGFIGRVKRTGASESCSMTNRLTACRVR